MNRQVIIILGILVILVGIIAYFDMKQKSTNITQSINSPSPTISQTATPTTSSHTTVLPSASTQLTYCMPANLQASISIDHAAGNVYGTLTLKNISSQKCQILGGQFIKANYDTNAIKNITITHQGQTQQQPFTLSSNQTLYSQVHYPNGPQCQTVGINQTPVTFTYQISSQDTVTFKDQNGLTQQTVQTCTSPTDMTEIQIWQLSTQPITP